MTHLVPKASPCTYALTYPAVAPCLWGLSVLFLPDNYLTGGALAGYFLQVVMSNQFDDFFSTVVFQKHYALVDYPQGIRAWSWMTRYLSIITPTADGQLCTAEGSSCLVKTHMIWRLSKRSAVDLQPLWAGRKLANGQAPVRSCTADPPEPRTEAEQAALAAICQTNACGQYIADIDGCRLCGSAPATASPGQQATRGDRPAEVAAGREENLAFRRGGVRRGRRNRPLALLSCSFCVGKHLLN